jgi:hypothetical protein
VKNAFNHSNKNKYQTEQLNFPTSNITTQVILQLKPSRSISPGMRKYIAIATSRTVSMPAAHAT